MWILTVRYTRLRINSITKVSLHLISPQGEIVTDNGGIELVDNFIEGNVSNVEAISDGMNGLWLVWNSPFPKATHFNSDGLIDNPEWSIEGKQITDIKGSEIRFKLLSTFSDGSLVVPMVKDEFSLQKVLIQG